MRWKVEQNTGTKDITKLGGLIKTMLYSIGVYFLFFFSNGHPPFGGFFAKYLVFSAQSQAVGWHYCCVSDRRLYDYLVSFLGYYRPDIVFLGGVSSKQKKFMGMVSKCGILAVLSFIPVILISFPISS